MGNKEAPVRQTAPEPNQQNPITQTPTRQQDARQQDAHNVSQSQIYPQPPVKSFNDNLDCLKKLTKTQKILLFLIIFALITATTVAIGHFLSIEELVLPFDVQRGEILVNDKIIPETVKQVEHNFDGKRRDAVVFGLGKKQVQVAHPNTQSILKAFNDGSNTFYEFLIPVFSIFEKFGIERKQKNPVKNWLQIINQNVRENVDKLSDLVAEVFSKKTSTKNGTDVPNKFNLTYSNLTEIVWALVKYDTIEENFKLVTITDSDSSESSSAKVQGNSEVGNLKTETKKEQKSNEKTQTPKSDLKETQQKQAPKDKAQDQPKKQKKQEAQTKRTKEQTQAFLNQAMVQTVGYIKRKAEQSIHVYKEQSEEIKRIHMQLSDKDKIEDQQQKALLECGVVQNILFRCPFKSVIKLVPGMTEQKLMATDGNFVLVYGLKIVLKETEQKKQ